MAKKKDRVASEAAAYLGKRGGQKRVPKGLATIDPKRRAEIVREGADARWKAYYAAHPEKLKAKLEREARKGTVKRGRPPKKRGVK
jgi:hypothetical protein